MASSNSAQARELRDLWRYTRTSGTGRMVLVSILGMLTMVATASWSTSVATAAAIVMLVPLLLLLIGGGIDRYLSRRLR